MKTTPTATRVRFEHHAPGRLGIGEVRPRLSWQVAEAAPGYRQRAARVEVTLGLPGHATETTVHDLDGPDQVLVPWPARPLRSRERAVVRVQVAGDDGWGAWSEPGTAEAGLLEPGDWSASFVGPAWVEPHDDLRRPARVRCEVDLPGDVVSARLYLSAHGLAEAEINGRRVGDEELTPGWTSYHHRLRYATFDVTDLVRPGRNAIGVWLGDGWWRGRLAFEGGRRDRYGDDLAALVQLEVTTADGARRTVASDGAWTAACGPIRWSSLYDGEEFDARLHDPAWSTPGHDDPAATPVRVQPLDPAVLVAPDGPPVRAVEELHPVTVERRGVGRYLLDFGQNHSGRLRITVDGPRGTTVTLRHAEVLQDGDLYTRTLRQAAATDRVTLAGDGPATWEPRFTVHGYRYAEVSGWPGELRPGDVVSRVLHSDLERTGWFRSSHAQVDRLHENVVWSLRSNVVDVPTDCPQRDERLGWTGDLQVFAPTAAFLFDVTGFLASWLQDLAAEQRDLGWLPLWIPYTPQGPWADLADDPVAVWGDVATLTPAVLHERTGDLEVLRRQYDSGLRWLRHCEQHTRDGLVHGTTQLGDWLDPTAPPDDPMKAATSPELVATAYLAHSARTLAGTARLLGDEAEADRLETLAATTAAAFAAAYLDPRSPDHQETQTALALTTVIGLWPDAAARDAGTARLAALVEESGGRIATGFAGTPQVTEALTTGDQVEAAYRLLECTEDPSWLSTVGMGATTIWERWDSMLPDGTVNPGEMTSFNHYALGAVADWLHRVVAGLAPAEPGYRTIAFAPRPGGSFTSAGATHLTPYGEAAVDWRLEGGELAVEVLVPVGARGVVRLPGHDPVEVGHGRHALRVARR
ncbi:family 78 glycoside hydrolase catalytic domain [Cellulomonas sp. Marseille-Q8402]